MDRQRSSSLPIVFLVYSEQKSEGKTKKNMPKKKRFCAKAKFS
jgi:hypothetical protein